jgi:hypothetical protein
MKISIGLLRFHNVYGPHSDYSESRSQAIPSIIRKTLRNEIPLKVWGSGNQYRDFLYVDDVINALHLVLEKGMDEGVIQIGSEKATSIRDLAYLITGVAAKLTGNVIKPEFDITRREGDHGRIAITDRARKILGWEAKINICLGILRTTIWMADDMGVNINYPSDERLFCEEINSNSYENKSLTISNGVDSSSCTSGPIAACVKSSMDVISTKTPPNLACKLFLEFIVHATATPFFKACIITAQTSKVWARDHCANRVIVFCDKDPGDPAGLHLPVPNLTIHTLRRDDHPWENGILALYASYSFIHRTEYRPEALLALDQRPPSDKHKFCAFLFQNRDKGFEGVNIREMLLVELNKYKSVDENKDVDNFQKQNAGTRFSENQMGLHTFYDANVELLLPYKFVIAIENTGFDDWITERIVNAYLAKSIPIYWGSENPEKYFNPSTYIDVRKFNSIHDVAEYVKKIDSDDKLYNSYFSEPPMSQEQWDSLFWWWHGKPTPELQRARNALTKVL